MKVLLIEENNLLLAKFGERKFEINGLIIKKDDKPDAFYDPTTSFFKAACPSGTVHTAQFVDDKTVNLF